MAHDTVFPLELSDIMSLLISICLNMCIFMQRKYKSTGGKRKTRDKEKELNYENCESQNNKI